MTDSGTEQPIRFREKGGVTLFYPSTRDEIFIPGARLAAGMDSSKATFTPYVPPPPCDDKHVAFDAWNGKLVGLSGHNHDKKLGDLNLWLTEVWAPDGPWFMNVTALAKEGAAHILYPIKDGNVPTNKPTFRETLLICKHYLMEGKSVHVSCIGGHGRTGMVMACLLGNAGISQPINFIREHGCGKWVEAQCQVDFISEFLQEKQDAKPRYTSFLTGGQKDGKGSTQGYTSDRYGDYLREGGHHSQGHLNYF